MKICVYCSAKDTIADEYKQLGHELGAWLASEHHTLVFGGATGGLMTAVSQAACEHKGRVIGVITHGIIAAGRLSPWCTRILKVPHMNRRKQKMKQLADCFVCLPGSYGTLDEMFDVIASGTVVEHKKPIYILNYKGFYNSLKEQIDRMKEEKFIPQEEIYKPIFVDDLKQLKQLLVNPK